jgi:hypothetical protein
MSATKRRDDEVTWDGVENMISTYYEKVIRPAQEETLAQQREEHKSNTEWLQRLDTDLAVLKKESARVQAYVEAWIKKTDAAIDSISRTLSEWKGSIRTTLWIIVSILIPMFLMVSGLFADLIKWGIEQNWKY